jgi:hypothetical protein
MGGQYFWKTREIGLLSLHTMISLRSNRSAIVSHSFSKKIVKVYPYFLHVSLKQVCCIRLYVSFNTNLDFESRNIYYLIPPPHPHPCAGFQYGILYIFIYHLMVYSWGGGGKAKNIQLKEAGVFCRSVNYRLST